MNNTALQARVNQAVSCFSRAAQKKLEVGKAHVKDLPELLPISDPEIIDLLQNRLAIAKLFITWMHGAQIYPDTPTRLEVSSKCVALELRTDSAQLAVVFTAQTVHFMRVS